jgi:hypothetical protein
VGFGFLRADFEVGEGGEGEGGRGGSLMMMRESIHVGGLCSRRARVISHDPGL